jgi:hypothetical protein
MRGHVQLSLGFKESGGSLGQYRADKAFQIVSATKKFVDTFVNKDFCEVVT